MLCTSVIDRAEYENLAYSLEIGQRLALNATRSKVLKIIDTFHNVKTHI